MSRQFATLISAMFLSVLISSALLGSAGGLVA